VIEYRLGVLPPYERAKQTPTTSDSFPQPLHNKQKKIQDLSLYFNLIHSCTHRETCDVPLTVSLTKAEIEENSSSVRDTAE